VAAPVIALLIIALVSLLVVRVGATALMMTGISWDTASFQAYSAFFGVGFTTKEAELVVNHPVRRRIIRDLILAGNVGLTSALATLIVSRLTWFQKMLDHVIQHTLERSGMVRALDYELLLRIQHGYVVSEIEVLPGTFLAGRTLRESRPWDRGVVILAITRDGKTHSGIPARDDLIKSGDILTAYGKESHLVAMTQPFEQPPAPIEKS
jgi:TrkA-C domain